MKIEFLDLASVPNELHKYAVIVTRHENQWIFVRHKERSTWEFPGGRREAGELIDDTANRELIEETGASEFDITPLCTYAVTMSEETSYGLLCIAKVQRFQSELIHEIAEIKGFDGLPKMMTYPEIIPSLFEKVMSEYK